MARLRFTAAILRVSPPWLQRAVGAPFMRGLAQGVDDLVDRAVEGLRLRFPDDTDEHAAALAAIGTERRIRRGPGEPAATYASRLARWLDDHRLRGNAYALLRQLYAFFLASFNVRIDVVAQSGTRHVQSAAGVITRDSISWNGEGDREGSPVTLSVTASPGALELRPSSLTAFPSVGGFRLRLDDGAGIGNTEYVTATGISTSPYDRIVLSPSTPVVGTYLGSVGNVRRVGINWARIWIFFHLTASTFEAHLQTASGEDVITAAGETLIVTTTAGSVVSPPGTVPDDVAETFRVVPREWAAAHLPIVTIVLLYGVAECWGYPAPMGTWGDAGTWGPNIPVVITASTE